MAVTVENFLNSFSNRLEEPVRLHLKNVYACVAMAVMATTVGAAAHLFTQLFQAGLLSLIGTLVFTLLLVTTPDDSGKNLNSRIGYLLGLGLCTGNGMGPLLDVVTQVNPAIIMTALIGTSIVFISFTICALLSERSKWLYLGGILGTMLFALSGMSLANIFFGSQILFQAEIYLGLAVMCGFVLYDTQLIIEKRRTGSKDFVAHSLQLFIDFIGIFRRLLIILTQKVLIGRRNRTNRNARRRTDDNEDEEEDN